MHHFAHKPPITCDLGAGETQQHLLGKELFRRHFAGKGYWVEVEYPLAERGIQLRADVLTAPRPNARRAFEIQHTPLDVREIERRTCEYLTLGIPVLWIPVLRPDRCAPVAVEDGLAIARYPARPYEHWIHGYGQETVWYFDPAAECLWRGTFSPYVLDVRGSRWYDRDGHERSAGAAPRASKRWRQLTLRGPYALERLEFRTQHRRASGAPGHRYPAGPMIVAQPV